MGWFGLKGGWLTFWVTIACATDMTLFGYDQGVFGGVIVTDDFLQTMGIVGNDKLQSTVTAIYDIGCFLGAISTIWIGERLGRKNTILVGTTIMSIGAILQTAAFGLPQMFVGRVVAGIGNGINTSTAPVWQGETSKASWRGKLIVIEMIMNIFGFSLSNWVTFGFSYLTGSISWRVPLAFQFFFIFILYGTVPWLPESPRWLMAQGRVPEAEQILADLEDMPVDDAYIQTQSKDIQWAINYERENTVPWSDLLRGRTDGAFGQFMCYAVITICIRYNEMAGLAPETQSQWAKASIAFFFLYYVFFGICWQGVPWLYPTEINSLSMRTKGAALGTATNWIVNFMVVEITPPGISALGWQFYIIWTVFNFSFIPIVYLFYPETADRSLEDVDRFFADNHDIFVFRDKDATSSKRPMKYVAQEEEAIMKRNSRGGVPGGEEEDMLRRRGAVEKMKKGGEDEEMAFGEHKERT
ncbi:hypothetical protein CFIO01_09671 [Colletotrichum fioriniae PJ7]|uniref:Major facilitator superfamily (MFS) profile domain-containing protein n=1 Tax=Colletotrichum fioriniae PJ7 TaxID=1445577 RepID=A0A010RQS1_9PEZI|nr:hypothetical protein CFIO01_09671 [Colletotrichum fioriniae PJ7]